MSAAHLYIFGWSQIKFSEVETEELRFGEQCELCLESELKSVVSWLLLYILMEPCGVQFSPDKHNNDEYVL